MDYPETLNPGIGTGTINNKNEKNHISEFNSNPKAFQSIKKNLSTTKNKKESVRQS